MDEELECRVCRGEPEEGRQLYAPCLCSGSIMYTHQDCLTQWLEHSGKDKCELCGHVFQFKPLYAENMPEDLPSSLIAWTLFKKTILEWSPFLARIILSMFLWLGFVPLATSWIYRIWIHRSRVLLPELFMERLTWNAIWNDCISGLIVVAAIMLSFLSLMSFADFLRFHWDFGEGEWGFADEFEQEIAPQMPLNQAHNDNVNGGEELHEGHEAEEEEKVELDDATINEFMDANSDGAMDTTYNVEGNDAEILEEKQQEQEEVAGLPAAARREAAQEEGVGGGQEGEAGRGRFMVPGNLNPPPRQPVQPPPEMIPRHLPAVNVNPNPAPAPNPPANANVNAAGGVGNNNNFGGGDFGGGAGDVEVNVALDELVGIRGPLTTLLRNVLWLLAFDGAYLGLFAFIPFSIGHSMYSVGVRYLSNFGVLDTVAQTCPEEWKAIGAQLFAASTQTHQTLQLADLAIIFLGYVVMSSMVFTWRLILCAICQRMPLQMLGRVAWGIECVAAVVKVGVLLTLKMLLTPLFIGWCLDLATLRLFDATVSDRIAFLGDNLVGSLLLHWVTGITFMLFVTVSILQVREVCHPKVLAAHIRPQEPHPDLLGSLLREAATVHARRMALTLLIYATLMVMFVCLPVMGASNFVPSLLPLKPVFYYFVPQLQIPVELVVFHLAMLASLEKYKNKIGHLQHLWLKAVCRHLGLTRYLLPVPLLTTTGDEEVIGDVLVRPPPGWDDPVVGQSQRWAWGDETPSQTERTLAKRIKPTFAGLRILTLLVLAWATILALVVCGILGPFVVGRAVISLCRWPLCWTHDPVTFALGLYLCWAAYTTGHSLAQIPTIQALGKRFGPLLSTLRDPKLYSPMGTAVLLWGVLVPLTIGTVFEMLFVVTFKAWSSSGLLGFSFFKNWTLGLVVQHAWLMHTVKQAFALPQAEEGVPPAGKEFSWAGRVLVLVTGVRKVAVTRDWAEFEDGKTVHNFCFGVFYQICLALLKPTFCAALLYILPYVLVGSDFASEFDFLSVNISLPIMQLFLFRAVLVWQGVVFACSNCKGIIDSFFKNIKSVVRDANYLIGLELQNHPETWKKASESVK